MMTRLSGFVTIAALFFVASTGAIEAEPEGNWVGEIRYRGGEMSFRVLLVPQADGARLDFPALAMSGIPAESADLQDGRFSISPP